MDGLYNKINNEIMAYSENTNLMNTNGQPVNPATEDTVTYLKKLIELLQPLSTQDTNQRLRVNVDAGTITTVSTLSAFGGSATLPTVTNLAQLSGVDARYLQVDTARLLYAEMIRKQLTFS